MEDRPSVVHPFLPRRIRWSSSPLVIHILLSPPDLFSSARNDLVHAFDRLDPLRYIGPRSGIDSEENRPGQHDGIHPHAIPVSHSRVRLHANYPDRHHRLTSTILDIPDGRSA